MREESAAGAAQTPDSATILVPVEGLETHPNGAVVLPDPVVAVEEPGIDPVVAAGVPNGHNNMLRGAVLGLVGGALFGLSGTAAKFVMESYAIDALWLATIRQLGACILFFAATFMTRPQQAKEVITTPRLLLQIIFLGVLGITFSQYGYLEAIHLTNSGTATVLQNASLVFLMVYTCVRYRRPPNMLELVAISLALAGIFLIATGGNISKLAVPLAGVFWALVSGLATSLISILPSDSLSKISSFTVNAFAMLSGGLVLCMITRPWEHLPAADALGLALMAFIVCFGTFSAYAMYVQSSKDAGPLRATLFLTVEPVVALLSSAVLLNQLFTVTDLLGFACIIATVFLASRQ